MSFHFGFRSSLSYTSTDQDYNQNHTRHRQRTNLNNDTRYRLTNLWHLSDNMPKHEINLSCAITYLNSIKIFLKPTKSFQKLFIARNPSWKRLVSYYRLGFRNHGMRHYRGLKKTNGQKILPHGREINSRFVLNT